MARLLIALLLALPAIALFVIGGFDVNGAVETVLFIIVVAIYSTGSYTLADAFLESGNRR